MIKVNIVDDDPLVSGALKIILEQDKNGEDIEVTEIYDSGKAIVENLIGTKEHNLPDVVLMDIRMEGINGLDAAERLINAGVDTRIVFLTTFLDDEYINRALSVGAKGYILKQDAAGIAACVRAVNGGQIVFGGKVVEKLPELLNRKERFDFSEYDITPKEQEIITLVADGLSNKEIADKMFLGEGTVRNMMSNILSKLGLRDRTQLAVFYYQKIKT